MRTLIEIIENLLKSAPTAALLGILFGWGLKTLSDYISMRRTESRTFRKATFFIMRAYKALLDYERGISYFRKSRPDVDVFEAQREVLEKRFLSRVEIDQNATWAAVNLLASVDPPLAARIDNTLKNLLLTFGGGRQKKVLEQDPEGYAQLIYKQDKLLDFTLSDLWTVALKLSARCGVIDRLRVGKWFKDRVGKGRKEFNEGMDNQTELMERLWRLKPDGNTDEKT